MSFTSLQIQVENLKQRCHGLIEKDLPREVVFFLATKIHDDNNLLFSVIKSSTIF